MINKIIEELEYHKIGWENTDEYNLQRRPFITAYEKAIEIVKRYENDGRIGYKTGLKDKNGESDVSKMEVINEKSIYSDILESFEFIKFINKMIFAESKAIIECLENNDPDTLSEVIFESLLKCANEEALEESDNDK